jgi:O-antigen/teichoic acid export membrane protein
MPIGILINGFIVILSQLNIRRKNYLLSSVVEVSGHMIIRIINVIYGLFTNGNPYGLIIGNQAGNSAANAFNLLKNLKNEFSGIRNSGSFREILKTARDFKNYPVYMLPGQLLNLLKIQGSIYFIGAGFGQSVLGAYSMSMNLLNIPIQVAGNSVSSVFLKNATEHYYKDPQNLPKFTYDTANSLLLISFLPFAILAVFGKDILLFLLGEVWGDAGMFASILSPYFYCLIVFSPIASVFQIYGKEKILFTFNLFTLVLNTISLSLGIFSKNPYLTMVLFSISNSVIYVILGWKIFMLLKLKYITFLVKISALFISSFLVLMIIKWGFSAFFDI